MPDLASPNSFCFNSYFDNFCDCSFVLSPPFNSFTLSAYLNVFNVCSQHEFAGETFAIIVVFELPVNESFNTYVNFDPLNGVCFLSKSSALMHSFNASKLLFISAPSNFVCLFVFIVSAPLSLPAKSIKFIFPYNFPFTFNCICRMAWDLELSVLAPVVPLVRDPSPVRMDSIMSSILTAYFSVSPTMFTYCLPSSLH